MLDVHAPHEAVHTWKGFFIHIANIFIGLLIAIALEQTVEFFHHHHEVAETRVALHEEMQKKQLDIDLARAFAGLPPETGNASF